ncbi:MAG: DUF4347 domain-containing protein [Beijerinckiaceae bacterium]
MSALEPRLVFDGAAVATFASMSGQDADDHAQQAASFSRDVTPGDGERLFSNLLSRFEATVGRVLADAAPAQWHTDFGPPANVTAASFEAPQRVLAIVESNVSATDPRWESLGASAEILVFAPGDDPASTLAERLAAGPASFEQIVLVLEQDQAATGVDSGLAHNANGNPFARVIDAVREIVPAEISFAVSGGTSFGSLNGGPGGAIVASPVELTSGQVEGAAASFVFGPDAWPGFERGAVAELQARLEQIHAEFAASLEAQWRVSSPEWNPDSADQTSFVPAKMSSETAPSIGAGAPNAKSEDAITALGLTPREDAEIFDRTPYGELVANLRSYADSMRNAYPQWAAAIDKFTERFSMNGYKPWLPQDGQTEKHNSIGPVLVAEPLAQQAGRTIIFVDARVEDVETLLANVPSDAEVVVIESSTNGLDQALAALAGREGEFDAIHIVSHGAPGVLELGATDIDGAYLQRHSIQLAKLGAALSANGDLLLYGCDIAAGGEGQEFVSKLAELTGADVAASVDRTGAAALGGDWDLEVSSGTIDTASIAAWNWFSTLASQVINATGGSAADGSDGLQIHVIDNGQLQIG